MTDTVSDKTLSEWRHHLRDEADAAFLYRRLSEVEQSEKRRDIYRRLADIEEKHTDMWRHVLAEHGAEVGNTSPTLRARILAAIARRFGPSVLLGLLRREEGQEVRGYLQLHRESDPGTARETALTLARESAEHASALTSLAGTTGEPWHRIQTGGTLGNIIYGFNDGLTANFGLVAGVIGAAVDPHIVLVTGVAGTIADALSMGASGYLAAKSEREVYAHEIRMEREEIRLMPELEQQELALQYEARGIEADRARQMAAEIMQNPERALQEQVRFELGIGAEHSTPLREGWVTATATAIGACIPVAPFFFYDGMTAIWLSFTLAMISHFVVGAARSVFTGRDLLRSGFDMFAVGLGVAAVGYLVGALIEQIFKST
ncbi:MAG: hypothetical protein CMJ18_26020 [Phycisphaeraceae bacterium]|nr:hypothetical protein [Phycisphaeraceae bacterium]